MRLNWIATLAALALALAAGASDGSARHSPPARNCEAIDASANSLGRQDCDDINALAARVAALEHSLNGETRADPTLVRRVTELEHWQSRAASRLPELQRLLEAIPQNGYEQFRGNIEATIRDARESFRTSLCGTWDSVHPPCVERWYRRPRVQRAARGVQGSLLVKALDVREHALCRARGRRQHDRAAGRSAARAALARRG